MNYYVVLGVPADADGPAIRSAFRSLVRRYHPDAGEGSSPEKFRLLVEAYETLIDPARRRVYDRSLRGARQWTSIPVEPMVAPIQPLTPQRPRAAPLYASSYASFRPMWTARDAGDLFDQLWRALEDDFFLRPLPPRG